MKFAVHLSHTCRPTHWHWWRSTSYRFEIQWQMVGQVGPDRWYYSALQTRIAETLNQWHRPKVPFWLFNLENSEPMRLDPSEFPRHLEKPCFRFHWRFWLFTQTSQYNKNQFFLLNQAYLRNAFDMCYVAMVRQSGPQLFATFDVVVLPGNRFTQRSSLWCFPLEFLRRTVACGARFFHSGQFFGRVIHVIQSPDLVWRYSGSIFGTFNFRL